MARSAWSPWWPLPHGVVAVLSKPRRPAGQPAHHQHHAPGQARKPPQVTAQVTVASLPSKAINDGAGPVDQSPSARSVQIAHHLSGTSRRDNSSSTTGTMAASPPGFRLRCHGLIHELVQVASYE